MSKLKIRFPFMLYLLCIIFPLTGCSKDADLLSEIYVNNNGIDKNIEDDTTGNIVTENVSAPDFSYMDFETAYSKSNLWFNQAIIEIKNLQGGLFTFDMNNVLEEDGGTIFKVLARKGNLLRNWDSNGIVKAEWFGMKPNDDKFDNMLAMNNLLEVKANFNSRFNVVLFDGIYNFDKTVQMPTLKDLTLKGVDKTNRSEFTSKKQYILFTTGFHNRFDNFSLVNIKTSSYVIDELNASKGNSAALWAFGEGGGRNHYIENCEFTAPQVFTNGFKYYADSSNDYVNITFKDCHFHDFGRFAIEIFGTRQPNYNPDNAAIKNVIMDGGTVERSGLMNHLGVSIVQSIKGVVIKNMIFRDNNSSLELGATNVKVFNNEFYGKDNAISFGGIYDSFDSPIFYQKNYEIFKNTGNVSGGLSMIIVEDLYFHDNDWTFNNSLYFNNVNNVLFDNEIIKVNGYTNWNGGSLIPTIQFFNKVAEIKFSNSKYEFLNSTRFSSDSSRIELENMEVYIKNTNDFHINSAKNMSNIKVFVDNMLNKVLNN
jgi:hypothetical protein